MLRRVIVFCAVVMSAVQLMTVAACATESSRWVVVGQERFGSDERVTVRVSRGQGRIARIRLEVSHGGLYVETIRVIYASGASERLRVGVELRAGAASAVYDLAGYGARVEAVEIIGQPGLSHGGRALVRLLGEPLDAGPALGEDRAFRRLFSPSTEDPASEGAPKTVLLDRKVIDTRHDQHILRPGGGAFEVGAIRVRVRGQSVRLRRILVVRDDGSAEEIALGLRLLPGDATGVVELGDGILKEVVVLIEPTPTSREPTLELEGLAYPGHPAHRVGDAVPNGWVLLGAGTSVDRDVVRIGAEAGRFRAIALKVEGGNVVLGRISIVYGDGRRDSYPVDKEIPDGTFTPGLKTKGDGVVDRVELVYAGGDERAIIEVYGEPKLP